jgi:hypothetical protein
MQGSSSQTAVHQGGFAGSTGNAAKEYVNMDMVQLKLQQRMLKDKLGFAQQKMGRLSEILHKKKEASSSSKYRPEDMTMTSAGVPVSDFKTSSYPKRLPPLARMKPEVDPSPVVDEGMLNIRHTHLQRTLCKQIVNDTMKEKERKRLAYEAKHKPKQFPKLKIPQSFLPNRYIRGELPCTIEHGANGQYLSWACPLENLDYEYYLPIFFDGLQCKHEPIRFLATQGIEDMLYAARSFPQRVIACMKMLVGPLRNAMSKFDLDILFNVLRALQQLLVCGDGCGAALMPYTRQFMAPMAAFLDERRNIGDQIDYGQRKRNDIGEEVRLTLELMEEKSGPTALKAIKFCIPCCKYTSAWLYLPFFFITYLFYADQSCMVPPDAHHHVKK